MPEYDEFKLLISPDAGGQSWTVEVCEAPIPLMVGTTDTLTPHFTREQLTRLRTASEWANSDRLKEIGDDVWRSLAPAKIDASLLACLQQAKGNKRGLR